MKRFVAYFLAAMLLIGYAAQRSSAQFIGFVAQQTVSSTPFNAVTCTGSQQNAIVPNAGQISHYVSAINVSASAIFLTYKIQGSFDGVNYLDISDTGTASTNGVIGHGYFPVTRIAMTCTSGATVTLQYSGSNATPGKEYGGYQLGQLDKLLQAGAAANANGGGPMVQTPFANAAGQLVFSYLGSAGPASSTLAVKCQSQGAVTSTTVVTYNISITTNGVSQYFIIPSTPACPFVSVTYTSGGASTATYNLEYVFAPPGTQLPTGFYSHVTTTTATAIKATPGLLHTVTINTGGAGTLSIFDLPGASCTGTPSTGTVAVITVVAATLQTFTYDVLFGSGICAKASVAMDYTASFQ